MFASLNEATVNAPVDATFLIIDHTFGRNNRNVGVWKVSEDCTNYNLTGGNSDKHSAESYHSTFTVSQVLSNVPNGIYSFQAQGFYRQDGSDNDNLAQFFINDETALVPFYDEREIVSVVGKYLYGNCWFYRQCRLLPRILRYSYRICRLGGNPSSRRSWYLR